MSKNEVATKNTGSMPAFLADKQKQASLGNIDKTDLIIPRVKLLQSTSPELDEMDDLKRGNFYHTIAGEQIGDRIIGIPIYFRKSLVLWSPRGDDRGILARSSDCIHWDEGFANQEFSVRPKGATSDVVYKTGNNVAESGLAEFGSSMPGDPNSKPAASLTYNMLWYFPELPDMSPVVIINTRSAVKPAKALISKLEMSPHDHFAHLIEISVKKEMNNDGDEFFNYAYRAAGFVPDEETYNKAKELYKTFSESDWRANDDGEEVDKDEAASFKPKGATTSSKF